MLWRIVVEELWRADQGCDAVACVVCEQPYDAAIEDEHEALVAMYEAMGAEKSAPVEEEQGEFPNGYDLQ